MQRRQFLTSSSLAASGVIATSSCFWDQSGERTSYQLGPVSSFKPVVGDGQVVKAIVHYKLLLFKQYHGFEQEQFPSQQIVPADIRKAALGDSPGIQVNAAGVRKLASQIAEGQSHPWEKAQAFVKWIRSTIRPQIGAYTSVLTAIQKKVGDCEEMSALFVAFCRASGIPARLVWVPNHNWAEFYLTDHEQKGHWIPAHPACCNWFGWTGAHELVIQKGDRVQTPEQSSPCRLVMDWMRSTGRPKAARLVQHILCHILDRGVASSTDHALSSRFNHGGFDRIRNDRVSEDLHATDPHQKEEGQDDGKLNRSGSTIR